jgi:hypothetical protein
MRIVFLWKVQEIEAIIDELTIADRSDAAKVTWSYSIGR